MCLPDKVKALAALEGMLETPSIRTENTVEKTKSESYDKRRHVSRGQRHILSSSAISLKETFTYNLTGELTTFYFLIGIGKSSSDFVQNPPWRKSNQWLSCFLRRLLRTFCIRHSKDKHLQVVYDSVEDLSSIVVLS